MFPGGVIINGFYFYLVYDTMYLDFGDEVRKIQGCKPGGGTAGLIT